MVYTHPRARACIVSDRGVWRAEDAQGPRARRRERSVRRGANMKLYIRRVFVCKLTRRIWAARDRNLRVLGVAAAAGDTNREEKTAEE